MPVMLLSTEAQVRDRVRGLKTGADEYVGKPYDSSYVVARARELIRVRQADGRANARAILVIEDSATFRNALCAVLKDAGYTALEAATGEDGLQSAVNNRPSAVIVDGRLPGIDGAAVIRRLREDAALRRTPCLLLTAAEDRTEELRALEAGADSFVRKNEDFPLILARLAAILRVASTPSAFDAQSSFLGPKKILAVDDSRLFREALGMQLRQEGYDVVMARSGEEALELLAAQPVDCILLDINLPGYSGTEICRRVKESSNLRAIPLLMLTSIEDRAAILEGINAGADDYIFKSSNSEVVRARIRAALRRKQYEDENRGVLERLLRTEILAGEERAQRQLAETRAALLAELRVSEERVQIAAEAADLGVWSWDPKTNLHECGARCISLFGLAPQTQVTHDLFLACLHPDDRARTDRRLRAALTDHAKIELEYRVLWPDGSLHWIVAKGRGSYDDAGNPLRLTGVAMDVTERKRTQEALIRSEKLASVGRMAATMAHEINNPLEAVMNALYLASSDTSLTSETRAHLDLAGKELDRVVHMAKQTLGFYRENSVPGKVHLPGLVDELVGLFSRKLSYKRIALERTYRGGGEINGIAGELRQIVSNLLANSIDALEQQGTVHIRISDFRQKRYAVRLTIADNGFGIKPEHLNSIFEPFFTTKKDVGTGLGLWVTRQIVEKHGGSIHVRSQRGKGAVFSVYLPNDGINSQQESSQKEVASG
jgi:PAS domain S-box-containing protein